MKLIIRLLIFTATVWMTEFPAFGQQSGSVSPTPNVSSENKRPENEDKNKTPSEKKNEVVVSAGYDRLTNDFGEWKSFSIDFSHKFDRRKTLYAAYNEIERYDQRDRQFIVGYYHPLNSKWLLLVEGSASPKHSVLAKWSGLIQVERNFKNGWNLQGGYKRIEYTNDKVNLGIGGVEKYWGNYRAAYTLYINNLENSGTSASHRFVVNRYYGEPLSSIGVGGGFGSELENLGGNQGVLRTDVQYVFLTGKHFFNRRWGINYAFTIHRQGDLYFRTGGVFGVVRRF
jgi:YaiO family outer membrane protein